MLYLASESPRRHELLKRLNVPFEVLSIQVDESFAKEPVEDIVLRLAALKARAGALSLVMNAGRYYILGADTLVYSQGKVLAKPIDKNDNLAMLKSLSDQTHEVYTGVSLIACDINNNQEISIIENYNKVVSTRVFFSKLTNKMMEDYWQTGEGKDKSGAYAIQGFGGAFVKRIEGSYSAVMGLPLFETSELLYQAGLISK